MMSRAVSHLGALRPESVGLSAAPLAGSRWRRSRKKKIAMN
jgi:hypothetical protein